MPKTLNPKRNGLERSSIESLVIIVNGAVYFFRKGRTRNDGQPETGQYIDHGHKSTLLHHEVNSSVIS